MAKKKTVKTSNVKETKPETFNLPHVDHPLINSKEFKTYIYGKHFSVLSIQKYKHIWKTVFQKHRVVLIHMYLRNGKKTQFIVAPKKPYFFYEDGLYVLDKDAIIDDVGSGYAELVYHQEFSMPVKPDFDLIKKYQEAKSNEHVKDIWRNVNPRVLAQTVMTSMIQKLQEVEGTSKTQIATMIIVCVNLFLTFMLMLSVGMMMFG